MTNFLLILILLAVVAGPLGVLAGVGIGAVVLFIVLPLVVVVILVRVLAASGKAIGASMPELPPGGGDREVWREADGWYCAVGETRFGPWSDRAMAENVREVERRRLH